MNAREAELRMALRLAQEDKRERRVRLVAELAVAVRNADVMSGCGSIVQVDHHTGVARMYVAAAERAVDAEAQEATP